MNTFSSCVRQYLASVQWFYKCIQANCIIVTKRLMRLLISLVEMLYSWLLPNSGPINQPWAPIPDNVVNIWGWTTAMHMNLINETLNGRSQTKVLSTVSVPAWELKSRYSRYISLQVQGFCPHGIVIQGHTEHRVLGCWRGDVVWSSKNDHLRCPVYETLSSIYLWLKDLCYASVIIWRYTVCISIKFWNKSVCEITSSYNSN